MRVKITRELRGSIDGIQLTHFVKGEVYEVSVSFGSYLMAEGAAEVVLDSGGPASHASADDRRRVSRSRTRE